MEPSNELLNRPHMSHYQLCIVCQIFEELSATTVFICEKGLFDCIFVLVLHLQGQATLLVTCSMNLNAEGPKSLRSSMVFNLRRKIVKSR